MLDGLAPLHPRVIGDQIAAVPHMICKSFPGTDAVAAILVLKPFASISTGSACTSDRQEPSYDSTATRIDEGSPRGPLRFSWCHLTQKVDVPGMFAALRALRWQLAF